LLTHKATDEMPADYPILDLILHGIIDLNMPKNAVVEQLSIPIETVENVLTRVNTSNHKRKPSFTVTKDGLKK